MSLILTVKTERYSGGAQHKLIDAVGWVHASVHRAAEPHLENVKAVLEGRAPSVCRIPAGWTIRRNDDGTIAVFGVNGGTTIDPVMAMARASLSRRVLADLALALLSEAATPPPAQIPAALDEPAPDLHGDLHAAGYRDGWNACRDAMLAAVASQGVANG